MVEGKLTPPMTGIGTATSATVGLVHGGKTATRSQTATRGRPVDWDDVIVEAPATDTGMRRSNNQDSYAVVKAARREVWESKGHLFMVADGMGAHAVGELASKM